MKLRAAVTILLVIAVIGAAGLLARWMLAHRRQPGRRVFERVVPKLLAPPIQPRRNERVRIVGYGSARPRVQLDVTAQVTGIVVERAANFFSGKYVRQGQVLFRIEETDYDLAVKRAEKRIQLLNAQLSRLKQEEENLKESRRIEAERRDLAERQVEKITRLLERKAASDNELDAVKETLLGRRAQLQSILNQLALIQPQRAQLGAEVAAAQIELEQAGTNLARCVVRSPVTGRVLTCSIEVGEQVLAGGNCGQLYGTSVMEVPVSIPATELEWIDRELLEICKRRQFVPGVGEHIEALVQWQQLNGGRTVTWRGCVERVEAGLEAETRTAAMVVRVKNPRLRDVDGNPDAVATTTAAAEPSPNEGKPMLEVNMFCKVTLLGRELVSAYVLPRRAILPDGGVYVVVDGRLAKRPVKVARFTSEEAMILPGGGVGAGDRVVIGTVPKPVIGMAVEAVDELPSGPDGAEATPAPGKPPPAAPAEESGP